MVTRKKLLLEQLAAYFVSKGKILTEIEYKKAKDVPIRHIFIKRKIGNWNKMIKMIKSNHPEVFELLTEVVVVVPKKEEVVVKPTIPKPTAKSAVKKKEEAKDEE